MRLLLPASLALFVLLLASPSGPCSPAARAVAGESRAQPAVPTTDCNGNGLEDAVDIALGVSSDVDLDGVPDECQLRDPAARGGR